MDEILKVIMSSAGTAGAILAWHLLVVNRKLTKLEEAVDRSTRTDLLRLVSSPHVADEVKDAAGSILKEVNAADDARKRNIL